MANNINAPVGGIELQPRKGDTRDIVEINLWEWAPMGTGNQSGFFSAGGDPLRSLGSRVALRLFKSSTGRGAEWQAQFSIAHDCLPHRKGCTY